MEMFSILRDIKILHIVYTKFVILLFTINPKFLNTVTKSVFSSIILMLINYALYVYLCNNKYTS